MCPGPPPSYWTTLSAVEVPELLILREFVTWVLVAVIVKLPVTVRLVAVRFPKF